MIVGSNSAIDSLAERIAIYAGTGRTRIDRALKFGGAATGGRLRMSLPDSLRRLQIQRGAIGAVTTTARLAPLHFL
jgi:hypothetical protein